MKKLIKTYALFILLINNSSLIAQEYRMDSMVLKTDERQYFTSQKFNSKKNLLETIEDEKLKSSSEIRRKNKRIELFNKDNELIETFYFFWNTKTEKWDEDEKSETNYNTDKSLKEFKTFKFRDGKMQLTSHKKENIIKDTIIIIESQFQENKIKSTDKFLIVKNSFGREIYNEIQVGNDSLNSWKKIYKSINDYKNDTIVSNFESFVWKDNQWRKGEKKEYEFDENNNETGNYITYVGKDSKWIPDYKYEKIDLPDENKEIQNDYEWSEKDNNWVIYSRSEFFFDNKGEVQKLLKFNLDTLTNELKLFSESKQSKENEGQLEFYEVLMYNNDKIFSGFRNLETFDDDGNLLNRTDFEYDTETDQWKESFFVEFFFDKNIVWRGQDKNRYFLGFREFHQKNKHAVKKVKTYNFKNGKKTLNEEYDYFYSIKK